MRDAERLLRYPPDFQKTATPFGVTRSPTGSSTPGRDRVVLGANGIVGGGPPLICGTALAAKRKGDRGVGVAFFGDGA